MSNRDFATVLIKLGGVALVIYAILNAVSSLPYFFTQPEGTASDILIATYLSKAIIPLILGLLLIKFGGVLVGRYMPDTQVSLENLESLEKTVLSVMGVFLLYLAASDLVYYFSYFFKYNRMIKDGMPMDSGAFADPEWFAGIVTTVFQTLLSLWLILGSAGLVNIFNRFRGR